MRHRAPADRARSAARHPVQANPACLAWLLLLLLATSTTAQEEYRPLRTGGLGAETAALLMSGQEGGSIPLHALAVPGVAESAGKTAVELFVEAPGAAILAGHEQETVRIEFCLYALAGSRVVDSSLETVQLALARDRERLLAGGVKSRSTLHLAAGEYIVRVLVRNVQTGELGLKSFPIEVPAADAAPALQSLLVADAAGGWLRLARDAGPPVAGFWPAARPVLAPDSDADLQILVRGLEPDSARLELSGADGAAIEVPAAVSPAEGAAPAGFERWLVRARLPYLEPGDYELSLRVADGAASPSLPIVVRQDGGGIWARAAGDPTVAGLAAEPSLPTVGDQRGTRRAVAALFHRLQEEYRAALGRLAASDMPGAVAALTSLEAAAFQHEGGADAVANAEKETARALAKASGGSLVPLFDLHYRAYRLYLGSQSFRLSSHARELLLDLVDLHLSRNPKDTVPATDILVVMANQLQQAGLARFSRVVFRRALQVDPTHEGALLGLATGLEKNGEYREASETLQQLLNSQPEHREARLRLAVNLSRSGSPARGRELFLQLLKSPIEDWVLAVAYHELVRDLVRRDHLAEAEKWLLEARQRLPEDDQIGLLLAAVLDARRDGSGDEVELALRSRADCSSARHHYQQWPRFTPGSGRDSEGSRLQALADALQGLRGEA